MKLVSMLYSLIFKTENGREGYDIRQIAYLEGEKVKFTYEIENSRIVKNVKKTIVLKLNDIINPRIKNVIQEKLNYMLEYKHPQAEMQFFKVALHYPIFDATALNFCYVGPDFDNDEVDYFEELCVFDYASFCEFFDLNKDVKMTDSAFQNVVLDQIGKRTDTILPRELWEFCKDYENMYRPVIRLKSLKHVAVLNYLNDFRIKEVPNR